MRLRREAGIAGVGQAVVGFGEWREARDIFVAFELGAVPEVRRVGPRAEVFGGHEAVVPEPGRPGQLHLILEPDLH